VGGAPRPCSHCSPLSQLSIELLNKAVADELSVIHQYLYFHSHLDDSGFGALANLFKRTAITETGHVERLAERILFLKGEVELTLSTPVAKIDDLVKMLAKAVEMEKASVVGL